NHCWLSTGHRAQWPGATSSSGGSGRAHSSTRQAHRGSKGHPAGTACSAGTVPSMVSSACWRSVCKVGTAWSSRSEEHTSELQSPCNLVCRLLLEKKNNNRSKRKHLRQVSNRYQVCAPS